MVEVQVIEASLYRFVAVAAFLESELLRIIQLCLESLLNMRPRERGESQRSGGLRLHLEYPVYRPPLDGATHRQAPLRNPRCTNRHHRQGQVAAFTCLSLSLSLSSSLSRVFLSLSLSLSLLFSTFVSSRYFFVGRFRVLIPTTPTPRKRDLEKARDVFCALFCSQEKTKEFGF